MNVQAKTHFELEVYGKAPNITNAFYEAAKSTPLASTTLRSISHYESAIYIKGKSTNPESLFQLVQAGNAILKTGGFAILVDISGKAYDPQIWDSISHELDLGNLCDVFVLDLLSDDSGRLFSCGMKLFNMKDAMIIGEDFESAHELMRGFNYYRIVVQPTILENQTFSLTKEAPKFRITNLKKQPYSGQKELENPFGMWQLTRVGTEATGSETPQKSWLRRLFRK